MQVIGNGTRHLFPPDWIRTTGDLAVYNNTLIYSVDEQDISLIPKEFYVTYGKINATTGLKTEFTSPDGEQMTMYPNPATNLLNIALPYSDEEAQIEVYDVSGRLMHAEQVNIHAGEIQSIVIDHLNTGYYLLKVNAAGELITRKFIRE